MNMGPFDSSRFLGYVSAVSPKGIQIHFPSASLLSRFRHEGIQYPGGNVGEFIVLEGENYGFVARILSLELPDSERKVLSEKAVREENSSFHPIANAELAFSFSMTTPETIERTISRFPEIGAKVYSCPISFLQNILSSSNTAPTETMCASLGKIVSNGMECSISLDAIFGRHCAVVGTTGSGKSWTVSRLIEALISKTSNKIIILDPTGEYSSLDENSRVKSYTIGIDCHFPYEKLHISDLFYLLRPTAQSQRPILMEAIRSLKTVRIVADCDISRIQSEGEKDCLKKLQSQIENGCLKKYQFGKAEAENFQFIHQNELDDAFCSFDFSCLIRQIKNECAKSQYDPKKWDTFDFKMYDYQTSLIFRVRTLMTMHDFNSVFQFSKVNCTISSPIPKIIDSFLEATDTDILRFDFSQISASFNVRELVANIIAKKLYSDAKAGMFKDGPVLMFLDEAHLFLNKNLFDADQTIIPLDAFDLIAKECRKFGLFLCLATQMPRDIPVGTLSQMGTFVVHRLINEQDRRVVETACSSASHASLAYLPVLGPGEALLSGVDFPIPLLLKVDKPALPPKSETPKLLRRLAIQQEIKLQQEKEC